MSNHHLYCVRVRVEGVPVGHAAVKIGIANNYFRCLARIRFLKYYSAMLFPNVPEIDAPIDRKPIYSTGIEGMREKIRNDCFSDLCFIIQTNYDFPDVSKIETCLHSMVGQRIDNKLYYVNGRAEQSCHHQYFNEMIIIKQETFNMLRTAFAQGTLDVYSVWRLLQVPEPNITKPHIVLPPQTISTALGKRKIFNGRDCYVLVKRPDNDESALDALAAVCAQEI